MTGTLFLVGTPIGNLGDMSDRARRTLAQAHLIAAEDTRRTGRLLRSLGIEGRFLSFFEANEKKQLPRVLRVLGEGRDVAVVSDAGMPGVSDPGYRLVRACIEAGIPVDVVPGPSALLGALVLSGLPTDRFAFEGFLPRTGRARAERLRQVARDPRTLVLFESPRRTARMLRDLLAECGDRRVAVVRELTKLHQEVIRGRLSEVLGGLEGRELKGELVLVLEGRRDEAPAGKPGREREEEAVALARELAAQGARKREAARRASAATGVPARMIYDALVEPYGAAGSMTSGRRRAETSE